MRVAAIILPIPTISRQRENNTSFVTKNINFEYIRTPINSILMTVMYKCNVRTYVHIPTNTA